MTTKRTLLTAAAALALGFTSIEARADFGGNTQFIAAVTAREAMIAAAQDSFWAEITKGLNDPDEPIWTVLLEASEELDEAIEEAEEVFAYRLELIPVLGSGPYDPDYESSDFSVDVDNTYFPLVPGRTLVYKSVTLDGEVEIIQVTTEAETVVIDGVECRQVRDIVTIDGEIHEDTLDWYAQHDDGDVWYFGEFVLNYDDEGFVEDIDGSFRAGVDGAEPGVLVPAIPIFGKGFRQEFLVNEAEDFAIVMSENEIVNVPAGQFANCRKTLEGNLLEPDGEELKFSAPGIGVVLELNPDTGEKVELIEIIEPSCP